MPTEQTAVRRSFDRWMNDREIFPEIVTKFDDSASLKVFSQAGEGIFPIPFSKTTVSHDVCSGLTNPYYRRNGPAWKHLKTDPPFQLCSGFDLGIKKRCFGQMIHPSVGLGIRCGWLLRADRIRSRGFSDSRFRWTRSIIRRCWHEEHIAIRHPE